MLVAILNRFFYLILCFDFKVDIDNVHSNI